MKPSSPLARLKSKGYRMTVARQAIVAEAMSAKRPFSTLEMHAILQRKKLSTNKVTVYRELQFLEKEGLLRGMMFKDGVRRYEAASDAHRHYLICTECDAVSGVEMEHDLDGLEKKIRKEKAFQVESHALEFYGLCADCR